MSTFPSIDDAHHNLVTAVKEMAAPTADPIPITVVSVSEGIGGQLVVFDGLKWPKAEIVKRLRIAADFLEAAPEQEARKALFIKPPQYNRGFASRSRP